DAVDEVCGEIFAGVVGIPSVSCNSIPARNARMASARKFPNPSAISATPAAVHQKLRLKRLDAERITRLLDRSGLAALVSAFEGRRAAVGRRGFGNAADGKTE